MAQKLYAQNELSVTRYAQAALTAYRFVKPYSGGTEQVSPCSVAGEQALGVVDAAWSADDAAVKVIYGGVAFVTAGGAVAVGDFVTGDSSGRAVVAGGVAGADFIHGVAETASSAAGDLISVRLFEFPSQGSISDIGAGHKLLVIPIASGAGDESAAEQDTGYDLPAKAVVFNVWLDVTNSEASTIEVGTATADSGDPDGWLDAASIASTGLVKGAPTLHGTNGVVDGVQGDLLWAITAGTNADDRGMAIYSPDIASGAKSIVWRAAADLSSFAANILIDYLEVK